MSVTQLYILLAIAAVTFCAGMYTESRFHLAGEVSKQNEQIAATRKGQIEAESLAGTASEKKNQIADIPPLQENPNEKADCTVPAGIFDQLSRTAETANRAAR